MRDTQERPGEVQSAAAELEDSLVWQKMDSVSKRLCAPQQAIVEYRITFAPILLAVTLAKCKVGNKKGTFAKRDRAGRCLVLGVNLHAVHRTDVD